MASATKLSSSVLMTSRTPYRTRRSTGTATQRPPASTEPASTTVTARTGGSEPDVEADPGRRDGTGVELSLGPDVEGAGAEGEREAQSDDDERHRADQCRRREGVPRAERPGPQRAERGDRVEAGECQPQRQHREADEQRAQRDQPPARAHGYQAPVTIMAPIVSRVAPAGGSTNSPRLATRTRVASASTSSRSLL